MSASRLPLSALIYQLHHRVHGEPRFQEVCRAYEALTTETKLRPRRIVDLGCGLGEIVQLAAKWDLEYVGVDSDPGMVMAARDRWGAEPRANFQCEGAVEFSRTQGAPGDVFILNGFVHHIDDESYRQMINSFPAGSMGIMVDHDEVQKVTVSSALSYMIQRLDLGKHVRPAAFYKNSTAINIHYSKYFTGYCAGYPLWPYFCIGFVRSNSPQ